MFGEEIGYSSTQKKESSDVYNADVDRVVKEILDQSFERVSLLLTTKDKELRRLSKYLYQHDYLDADEMDKIIRNKSMNEE